MAFEPQNKLEESLIRAAKDPAHRPQFYKDLVESDLFVIQEGPPPASPGRHVAAEGESLNIRPVEWNGTSYLPVFSSLPRLQVALQHEASYVALNALEFMKMTRGAHLLLNPGSDYGKAFPAEEIASILDGSMGRPTARVVAKSETQVLLGQPANYPQELVDALSRLFKTTRQVKRAYLAHYANPSENEKPHTLIGLEVTGDWDAVLASTGIVVRDVHVPDPPVDIIQITNQGGLSDYFLKQCKPFYERKVFGIF